MLNMMRTLGSRSPKGERAMNETTYLNVSSFPPCTSTFAPLIPSAFARGRHAATSASVRPKRTILSVLWMMLAEFRSLE